MNTTSSLSVMLREKWTRLADRIFGEAAAAAARDEMARGEFIDDCISGERRASTRAGGERSRARQAP